ncbi:MAG: hypothetical protein QW041_00640 [Candidatus Pacearchaeota archaeon]
MIYFIKKIFQDKIDETVHWRFVRFSKGIFENRAIMNVSRNGKIKISGTYDLVNDLVLFVAKIANNLQVSGILMMRSEIKDLRGTRKKGLFVYELNQKINFEKLNDIFKNAFAILLDCNAEGITLKTKKKLPKPSIKGIDKIDDKFFTIQMDIKFWPAVKEEFLFDLPEGKKYRIINKYEITDLILPQNEKDSEKLRLLTKRKGKVVRKSIIDGREIIHEKSFTA